MTDIEMNLIVNKDYHSGKCMVLIAYQSGMSYSTIALILKNENKGTEATKGSTTSSQATRLTKVLKRPISDVEKLLMTWIEA